MDGHRHGPGPEHDFEPVHGLPQSLPDGERILWQGAPDAAALARRAFHVRKIAAYFAVIAAAQLASAHANGDTLREALAGLATLLAMAAVALGVLAMMARLAARAAVYTITDRRVVMRVGIVLTLTFNLPFSRIVGAGLREHGDGTADLPLELGPEDRIGYWHLWPHARPWRIARPSPMLRCVPDGARVGRLLADAWARSTGGVALPVAEAARPVPAEPRAADRATALAGR
jgi:hypothetical protein